MPSFFFTRYYCISVDFFVVVALDKYIYEFDWDPILSIDYRSIANMLCHTFRRKFANILNNYNYVHSRFDRLTQNPETE